MNRRSLLTSALALTVAPFAGRLGATSERVPVRRSVQLQTSPLAGFQYHAGEAVWPSLAAGQPLQLAREPANTYDRDAVRVDWRGRKLGYLPRAENTAAAQLLDRGERLSARIDALARARSPWQRIRIAVNLEVA